MSSERPGSRLPDDPAYWEKLAARSVEAALRGGRGRQLALAPALGAAVAPPWWRWLSDSALALAAGAVLALMGGALLLGERSLRTTDERSRTTTESSVLADALAPDDPLLRIVLDEPDEPASAALLRLMALREEAR